MKRKLNLSKENLTSKNFIRTSQGSSVGKRIKKERKVEESPSDKKVENLDKMSNVNEETVKKIPDENGELLDPKNNLVETASDVEEINESVSEGEADEDDLLQNDPFIQHLNYELCQSVYSAVSSSPPKLEKYDFCWPALGNLQFVRPSSQEDQTNQSKETKLLEKNSFAKLRMLPGPSTGRFNWNRLYIKKRISENIEARFKKINSNGLSDLQKEILIIASNYHDIYYPEETFENMEDIQFVYCIHAVNHVLKARLKVLHHNAKLSKKSVVPEEFRDQGLVRPKVLIILPFREAANRVVKILSYILLGDKDNVMNKKRFMDEYTGSEINMPEKNPKPPDYQLLFSGNTDDNFRIGLTVTKKCLKLYADFYSSDIIIASPLGLRMLIGAENEKKRDHDFLSSVELLIMDQSQVFVMQNWEHVTHVMSHLHLQPKETHDTDLSRVRMWALNGWSKYYMQSLIFSSQAVPEVTALFNTMLCNYGGKVSVINPVKVGTVCQVAVHAPQVFHEISTKSCLTAVDDRFEAFISDILPQFKDSSIKHTLIFIPSYFDFVRLRNYFKKQELKFVQICEYTQDQKITRARSKIFHGKTQFLLYTERFHFYRRIKLRGLRHIIFYQPPTNPTFYSEICNFLHDFKKNRDDEGTDIDLSVNVLYTKFDIVQLAAIIGTDRAVQMLASDKTVHMFMSD